MLKRLCLFCALILVVSCSKSEEKPKPSFLLVVISNHGEIRQASDGSWELVLDHGDIEKVLAFSDRPYRVVKHLAGDQLQTLWSKGSNAFEEDPPNATVVINQHLQTVELLSLRLEGSKTIFKIRSDGSSSMTAAAGRSQVFIDSFPDNEALNGPPTWRQSWN